MDYEAVGLKAGLEIHQQLNTKEKLFCHSPTVIRDSAEHTGEVSRYLRVAVSEMGDVDRAAKEELMNQRLFTYYTYDTTGLVEIDEEPPAPLNPDALDIVLTIAKMFEMTPLPEIHTMRKMIVDGSATSGFQRTALVALNGAIEHACRVETVAVEEEACQRVEDTIFSVDRLGIPLIEITTSPCMKTPEEVHDIAQYIGMTLRSTGRVKRGIGTIRQDVNVSIRDGARVEIKGVQELDLIAEVVRREVQRQLSLLAIRDELQARNALVNGEVYDVTSVFARTQSQVLKKARVILGTVLHGFNGLVGLEIQPDRRLGSEMSDYAKKCGVGGLFHTDELPAYGVTEEEVHVLKETLGAGPEDAVVIVASTEQKCRCAMQMIIRRAKMAFEGVPEETRKMLEGGSTAYMRPLPGAARMYPETDILPVPVTKEYWESIAAPELLTVKAERFVAEYGLDPGMARQMAFSEELPLFERAVSEGIRPVFAARTILASLKELSRAGISSDALSDDAIIAVMKTVEAGNAAKEAVLDILTACAKGMSVSDAVSRVAPAFSREELQDLVHGIVNDRVEFIRTRGKAALGPVMGVIMKEVRGRIDGKVVSEVLDEELGRII
ncbi:MULTISPECIES: Glu-tRNA(Gln) amidotransferase subunit GatE [Methanocorpusculum]|jgi:glutamyl-tRNA(Gln) amidotransferase subunit E|uniref:Glu-tRNA(Gln) amidotransferase subunit GatE n=1 Tax=Methanocorpusculum TaxID=2192 RepID=UPI0005B2578B|nr:MULTISPECIES: Glu-tRNA(Gln) amidotransferase subunit GatE [Methanocorpusculum]MDD4423191.1 Glu-tRNA(Gln) amidotransferase subunit GatE [Methanocorpusculum parvum]MDD2248228.1 Glu-tRNA(Gln) amidotransferase subunit GatE [Methanocorpusculum sp.]MDD2802906.1 Glu-tRNA(Gln) amidotransferase subunit GatE [Methanocorpusculum sp.]MDD3046614.1 Glu-tRNA(Gln) amidotransferase subunit GatE [Methanocorpusculum sp.]MDD3912077.1 Glu-tRNA(Gln) amidotransferase subunit GatE [Methanocorpusculum sp.]